MTTPEKTPLPRIEPRRSFLLLPLPARLSTCAVVAVVLLALFPIWIDGSRATSGQLKQARSKPRSVATALTRLERHYSHTWWTESSPGERRVRQHLLLMTVGVALLGALAGRAAQEPDHVPPAATPPYRYGAASVLRARSALASWEDQHG